jgi:cholesterol transport system auxiliary component
MSRILVLLLALGLGACGNLFKTERPAATAYALSVPNAPALSPQLPSVLLVHRPSAAPGLDSDRVIVEFPDGRMEAYSGVRFAGPVTELVQAALTESLRARGGWRAVLDERGDIGGQFRVQTEVREFTARAASPEAAPRVRVRLTGVVARPHGGELLVPVTATGEVQASDFRQGAVIAAFDAALAAALTQYGDAIYAACAGAEPAAH